MRFRDTAISLILLASIIPAESWALSWYDHIKLAQQKILGAPASPMTLSCADRYEKVFSDDTLNITLAFGYADGKPSPTVFDAYMQDAIVDAITAPCQRGLSACGFQDGPRGTNSFYKWVNGPRGKRQFVVLKMLSGTLSLNDQYNMREAKKLQDEQCAQAVSEYNSSVAAGDEVVFYLGHSRDGGGPDFCPGRTTADNHVDYSYYRSQKPGLRPLLSSLRTSANLRRPVEFLGLFSCSSRPHFYAPLRQASPETGYILTNRTMKFTEVFQDFYIALDAVLGRKCDAHYKGALNPDTVLTNVF